jgi:hypothetical protein
LIARSRRRRAEEARGAGALSLVFFGNLQTCTDAMYAAIMLES